MSRFNPEQATAAYIDSLGPAALAKAQAYTTGGHWLLLWGLLVTALASWIIIRWGVLDWLAATLAKRGFALRTWIICASFLLISAIITLPWGIYTDWWRERAYGRSSQPLGDFLLQGAISTVLTALLGGLFLLGIYALIRRTGRRWWLWSGGLAAFAISALLLLSPVLIEPLFNSYTPVPNGPVRDALLVMADEAGIPHDRIFVFDGSRQSNNFTANVSGVLGSARIAISDVALGRASLDEVKAVTGHEIGHYVEGHIWWAILAFSLIAVLLFFLADRLFARTARLLGGSTQIDDPVGLPVLMVLIAGLGLLATPLVNTLVRIDEASADAYSMRTVNLPDAMAGALLKSAEYRYPRPSAIEETIFYDHPSVENRIRAAMEWKATHPANPAPTPAGQAAAAPQ